MNWYKKAKLIISPQELEALKELVKKIMRGSRNWTPQDLQLQSNYPELLEKLLKEKYELV